MGHPTKSGESVEPKWLIDCECHLVPAGRWPVCPAETWIHGLVHLLLWGLEIKRQDPKQMQQQTRLLAGCKKKKVAKEGRWHESQGEGRCFSTRAVTDAGGAWNTMGDRLRLSWCLGLVVSD